MKIYATVINVFDAKRLLVCDGKCNKAFGINARPKHYNKTEEEDPDDYAFLADWEVGEALPESGTTEGGHNKPVEKKHHKWCYRQCERSTCSVSIPCNADTVGSAIGIEIRTFETRLENKNRDTKLVS
jgi:hypothetical protein